MHRPFDNRTLRAVKMQAVGIAPDRHRATVKLGRIAAVDLYLVFAGDVFRGLKNP